MPTTGAKVVDGGSLREAKELARGLDASSGRRKEIPVRTRFVRSDNADSAPPLARLVSARGRGGAVPIKLHLALIWRCSAFPFSTDISARKWAALLGLEDPSGRGARRITAALDVLERERLVTLERRRGDSTIVTLLDESGFGDVYRLPSTAHSRASTKNKSAHRYFKVPARLWTEGHIQAMSAPAVAMLLVLLAERNLDLRPTWWSTELFPRRFGISAGVRAQGTRELVDRGLLTVEKQLVADAGEQHFGRERVRNLYRLDGDARPEDMAKAMAELSAARRAAKRSGSGKAARVVIRKATPKL